MRKFAILITLFLLILQAANAQNQKGNQNLGLSLGFYTGNGSYNYQNVYPGPMVNTRTTGFSTNPNYSYFIANKLDIGASIGISSETDNANDQTTNTSSKQVNNNYYGSIYLRKYFLYNNKIGIRAGPSLTYQYTVSNITYTPINTQASSNDKGHYYQAGLNADFVYYPSTKIGLAVNLGNLSYSHNKTGNQMQSSGSDSFSLQFLNNSLMLSAFYVFGQ
jgi:hypothetical protein